ncbi:MAG: SAM-dependent methyltransferase [Treponema sp.]|nr:SAM-dependent methyltransferase [Treponema sp.]
MQLRIEPLPGKIYLSFPELFEYLLDELRDRFLIPTPESLAISDDMIHYDMAKCTRGNVSNSKSELLKTQNISNPYFARCVLEEPFLLHFDSISQCANTLKNIQRNWAAHSTKLFRRTSLIQEKLPYINLKAKKFPIIIPKSSMGFFTLLDEHSALCSAKTSSFLPTGMIQFIENHTEPPSRAYLKLQEALTMMNLFFNVDFPKRTERCFDAGASPGGWTWLLTKLGCKIFAVDRAPLSSELMENENVTFQKHDAFTLLPKDVGYCDWVFSDVICYPERLYEWVNLWISSKLCKRMICTIKMQGSINWSTIEKFAELPNSKVLHLNYNKHELTWLHVEETSSLHE